MRARTARARYDIAFVVVRNERQKRNQSCEETDAEGRGWDATPWLLSPLRPLPDLPARSSVLWASRVEARGIALRAGGHWR